jgi:hypothetical protein
MGIVHRQVNAGSHASQVEILLGEGAIEIDWHFDDRRFGR